MKALQGGVILFIGFLLGGQFSAADNRAVSFADIERLETKIADLESRNSVLFGSLNRTELQLAFVGDSLAKKLTPAERAELQKQLKTIEPVSKVAEAVDARK